MANSRPASLCPGCGKGVDPLRAGHVAIVDGVFRYFCTRECKQGWGSARQPTLDAATAEPPAVSPRDVPSSGVRAPLPTPRSGIDHVAAETPDTEPDEPEDAAPETLRSADVEPEAAPASAPAPRAKAPRARGSGHLDAIAILGIACGVFAAVVSLAGDAALVARLPLALAAAALVVVRVTVRARAPSEPSRWAEASPVIVAAVAAGLARTANDPHADADASFVGLAAAAVLVFDVLFARARRDVDAARERTAGALASPARLVAGDATAVLDASAVKPGEQVLVEAGETLAVDGVVAAGAGEVAPWVDAPIVLSKGEGDAVVAGATVVSGRLRVTATFTGTERAWLKLATSPRVRIDVAAPLVALARRAVERGAPIAAVLVGGATYANNGTWPDVVIAACAGAFAVAASAGASAAALAHARAHVAALRRGIVYKDAEAFDAAGRAAVAVMCSRGTILRGEPELVAVESASGDTNPDVVARVLSLAAGAEMASAHPFAGAVLAAARARGVRPENVRSAIKHFGLGVTALAPNGDKIIVGSRSFLLSEKVSVAIADTRVSALEAEGRSVLLVAVAGRLVGLVALQDGLRNGVRAAVRRLHDARIEPVLLSGEARDTCETIARALDIEHVRPEILPGDRGAEVRALAEGGHVVAALGHAASDDGALGAAEVSVAMGAAGAAPGEWSAALASDDVRDAALALIVPRACRDRSKVLLAVGAGAQALATLVIAFGLAPPAAAPVLGVAAAVVVLVGMRDPSAS